MDRIDAMRTFVSVVDAGSFTAAADRLGVSKALASKYVSRLEARLGARLINRTTRRLALTEAGQVYYERCRGLLADYDEMEALVEDHHGQVRGLLRISAPLTFGEMHLAGAVGEFLARHEGLRIELDLSDRTVDLIEEGFDVAVRIGQLPDSSLIARRLSPARMVVCASRAYFERSGRPRRPEDLAGHRCIIDSNFRGGAGWPFRIAGERRTVKIDGRYRVNSARAVRDAILSCGGVALCPYFVIAGDVAAGRVEIVLADYEAADQGIFAVYPHSRHLAAKVRAFVDFLAERAGTDPAWG